MLNNFNTFRSYYNYHDTFKKLGSFVINPKFSIDFAKVFIPQSSLNSVESDIFIRQKFSNILPKDKKGRVYLCDYSFGKSKCGCRVVKVFRENIFLGTSIKISHPTSEIPPSLDEILTFDYSISAVEYTLDMYSLQADDLFYSFKHRISLKYAGGYLKNYETTCYLNNPRKAMSCGSRMYLKEVSGKKSVRLEVVRKRRYFKEKNIHRISTALNIHADKVFDRIKLQEFNLGYACMRFVKTNNLRNWFSLGSSTRQKHLDSVRSFERDFFESLNTYGVSAASKICRQFTGSECFQESAYSQEFDKMIAGQKFI